MTTDEVASYMSDFGSVLHVEAPTIDEHVTAELEEKGIRKDYHSI